MWKMWKSIDPPGASNEKHDFLLTVHSGQLFVRKPNTNGIAIMPLRTWSTCMFEAERQYWKFVPDWKSSSKYMGK